MSFPLLLLCFNRPELTEQALRSLKELKPSALYVAVDGPRKSVIGEAEAVSEVLETVARMSKKYTCPVHVKVNPGNFGGARAVFNAVSWFFSFEKAGLIAEDDCTIDASGVNLRSVLDRLDEAGSVYSSVSLADYLDLDRDQYGSTFRWTRYHTSGVFWSPRSAWEGLTVNMAGFPMAQSLVRILRSLEFRMPSSLFWCLQFLRLRFGKEVEFWDIQFTLKSLIDGSRNIVINGGIVTNHGMISSSSGRNYEHLEWISELPTRPLDKESTLPRQPTIDVRADIEFEKKVLGLSWSGLLVKVSRRLQRSGLPS